MKKLFPLALLALSFTACESSDTPLEYVDSMPSSSHKRTEAEAVKLARKAVGSSDQRSRASQSCSISLITDQQTRSNGLDTLCYIVNFDDEQGFALIAYDKRVTPVLAYSEQGNFTTSNIQNTAVDDCFIKKLPAFINNSIENAAETNTSEEQDSNLETCYSSSISASFLGRSWNQSKPYNQSVALRYPNIQNIVVGCVPLAACQVMVFGKDELIYHNIPYDFSYIRESLQNYNDKYTQIIDMEKNPDAYADCTEELNTIKLNYDISIGSLSKILEHLGEDLHANYEPFKTAASTKDAMVLLRSLGYNVSPSSGTALLTFNPTNIVLHIFKAGIVQIRGYVAEKNATHSWVMYSATYCRSNDAIPMPPTLTPLQKFLRDEQYGNIEEMYVFCEWGWDGNENGFYNTKVFNTNGYSDIEYYSVEQNDVLPI